MYITRKERIHTTLPSLRPKSRTPFLLLAAPILPLLAHGVAEPDTRKTVPCLDLTT